MDLPIEEQRDPVLAPPTLYADWNFNDKAHLEAAEAKTWKRIVFPVVSFACAATAIAFKVKDVWQWNSGSFGGPMLSLVAGFGIQNGLQTALSHRWSNEVKSFVADYSLPAFLTLSQVYNNFNQPVSAALTEGLFSPMAGIGGVCLAALTHVLVARRLSDTEEMTALKTESGEERHYLPLVSLNSRTSRVAWNVGKLVLGTGGIFLGVFYPPATIARDISIMFVGDAVSQLGHELWVHRLEEGNDMVVDATGAGGAGQRADLLTLTPGVDFYFKFMKVFLVAAHVLPGMLIAGAAGLQKAQRVVGLPYALYFLAGFAAGGKRHLEWSRFTNVPVDELRELKRKPHTRNTPEKVFWAAKWFFSTVCVGGFIGLGIAGFSFQTMNFQPVELVDRASLIAVAVGLYGSYTVARLAKHFFKPDEHNTSLRNTAYFLTHYSPGIPWFALYIIEKMDIGDEHLNNSTLLTGVLATLAYLSLGNAIGLEAAARGEYPHPRVFSATSAALIFRAIIEFMTNQLSVDGSSSG